MVQLINNFSLTCAESQQNVKTCICDFRVNENNCAESFLLKTGSWILIPYTSFIAVVSILFLWYRVYYKGQSLLFPPSRERGIIRPRPHDAFHLVTVTFSLLNMVRLLLLIRNAYSSSKWAEIMDDLPRQTSFSFSVLYLIGIIYSIPTLEPAKTDHSERFIPNKYLVDAGAIFLMIGPYIVNTPISYFIGYYSEIEETPNMSIKLFTAKYLIWVFWLMTYLSTLLYFWRKLVSLLKYHMKELQNKPRGDFTLQWKYETLKVASTNLSTVVMVFAFLGSMFVIVYLVFGISYKTSAKNYMTNVIYFVIWNFVEPICLQIAQFIIIYNAVRPTPNKAPFGRMLSVVRKPVSMETSRSSRSRSNHKYGFAPLSEKSKSESSSSKTSKSSNSSKKSIKLIPEIQTKSIISDEDLQNQLPTPFTPYTTGWDELLPFDNLEDFFAGEIPIEHQNTHCRRDSSIEASSFASTTYFSTTQSIHSKNDSLYSLQLPNGNRASKRSSPLYLDISSDLGSEIGGTETLKKNTSLFLRNSLRDETND